MAAQHDHLGIGDVDQARETDAEPPCHLNQRTARALVTGRGARKGLVDVGSTGRAHDGVLADLGLPAAHSPAAAYLAGGVDPHVAHLAAVTAGPDERSPVDEQAAADADVAAEVDHVVRLGSSTT